jgi:hypothetical protein
MQDSITRYHALHENPSPPEGTQEKVLVPSLFEYLPEIVKYDTKPLVLLRVLVPLTSSISMKPQLLSETSPGMKYCTWMVSLSQENFVASLLVEPSRILMLSTLTIVVGSGVGCGVGSVVGRFDGAIVGTAEGDSVGAPVGTAVGGRVVVMMSIVLVSTTTEEPRLSDTAV